MKQKLVNLIAAIAGIVALTGPVCSVYAEEETAEISETKAAAIVAKCDNIKESLITLQHNDSRTRVYLGRKYEAIISNYITPLNVSLVENNISTTAFIKNQNDFVTTRDNFVIDYIEYQKNLEDLVNVNCKTEPEKFYGKLTTVRAKRKIVADDVTKLRKLTGEQINLATELEAEL